MSTQSKQACPISDGRIENLNFGFKCDNVVIQRVAFINISNALEITGLNPSLDISQCYFSSCPNAINMILSNSAENSVYKISKTCFSRCSNSEYAISAEQNSGSNSALEPFIIESSSIIQNSQSSYGWYLKDFAPKLEFINVTKNVINDGVIELFFTTPKPNMPTNPLISYMNYEENDITEYGVYLYTSTELPTHFITQSLFFRYCNQLAAQLLVSYSSSIISIISNVEDECNTTISNIFMSDCNQPYYFYVKGGKAKIELIVIDCYWDQLKRQTDNANINGTSLAKHNVTSFDVELCRIFEPSAEVGIVFQSLYNYAIVLVCGLLMYPVFSEDLPLTSFKDRDSIPKPQYNVA